MNIFFFEFIEYHCICFGRSLRPSSGVQGCTHSVKYYLLAGTRWNGVPSVVKRTCLTYTWRCV